MIKTFSCKHTKALWETGRARRLATEIWKSGRRALEFVDAANSLPDLRGVGSSLERLSGSRYAIRVNDKYRLCFDWPGDGHAYNVEIVDYH